jgi:hypothetical protein
VKSTILGDLLYHRYFSVWRENPFDQRWRENRQAMHGSAVTATSDAHSENHPSPIASKDGM